MADSFSPVRRCTARHGSLGPCDLDAGHAGDHTVDYSLPFYAKGSYVVYWTDEQAMERAERLARLGHAGMLAESFARLADRSGGLEG